MKKFFSMIMIAAAALSFAACSETPEELGNGPVNNGSKLETPVPTAEAGDTWLTISWEAINGADSYSLNCKGKNYTTAETSYKFENLNAGEYTVRVKATGEGYKDSDYGSVTVTLTGATSVTWFESSVAPAKENAEKGYGPYNAVEFTWKGTGVKSLSYGLYISENLIGVDDKTIKDALTAVEAEDLAVVNSAEGLSAVIGPINGDTTYTMCLLAVNESGVEFFSKQEVTTESAQPSDAAKAWIGTWTVNSTQEYHISVDEQGKPVTSIVNNNNTFTVNITASPNDPNEVVIDGWSVLGEGFITYGEVEGNTLFILNGTFLGMSEDSSYRYYWLGWYSELIGISIDAYPSNVVTNDEGVVSSTNKFNLYYEDGTPAPVECYASDVFGVSDTGNIYFIIEAYPGIYRTGDMTWTKSTAAAQALSAQPKKNLSALPTSIVVSK